MSLRKKIANSKRVQSFVTTLFEHYIRFCFRSSKWERIGFEPMDQAVRNGEAVIFVVWHQRLIMAPYMFDMSLGPICSLTADSRAGRLAGDLLGRFGFDNVSMRSRDRHVVASRKILKRINQGMSVGIAADGPRGPARTSSDVPIMWSRSSGKRIFAVAFSQKRTVQFPTWDKQWLPSPFSRGVFMCQEWDTPVPRRAEDADYQALQKQFEDTLETLTPRLEALVARPD